MLNHTSFTATKIICTLGPASDSEKIIEELIKAGMSVARLNFSHGTHAYHRKLISRVRRVAKKLDQPVAILQDLSGPKIRVGRIKGGSMELNDGEQLSIYCHDIVGEPGQISAFPANIIPDLKKGEKIFIDDGLLRLRVIRAGGDKIEAKVIKGGLLREHKGINVPDSALSLPSMTRKDEEDLKFGVGQNADYVALSFVRTADDIRKLKARIRALGADIPVIAKLEKPQAVTNLNEILKETDAVMVARGDLGIEIPIDQVPAIQKEIISTANECRIPVITATQMLESMTDHISPTRAEVSDVANAIYDGTDCVMLSAETATGEYPVESVKMMQAVAATTETRLRESHDPKLIPGGKARLELPAAIAQAAVEMAIEIDAKLIACFTQSGLTARLVSKQRATVPIIAYTPQMRSLSRMSLYRGVIPHYLRQLTSVDHMIAKVEESLKAEGIVESGDRLVIVASAPVRAHGDTNMLKLHEVS